MTLRRERLHSAHIWMINHDESRVFNVLYISLAVILSVFVSLFWLVLIVGIHFMLELIRQHHHCSRCARKVLGRSLWQLKLDFSFIAFSFVVDAYIGVLLGAAGLGKIPGLGRIEEVEISDAARLGGYGKAIRGIALSTDDILRTTSAAVGFKDGAKNDDDDGTTEDDSVQQDDSHAPVVPDSRQPPAQPELAPADTDLQVRWTRSAYATVAFGITCVALLFLVPWLIGMSYGELWQIIIQDLQPFPT